MSEHRHINHPDQIFSSRVVRFYVSSCPPPRPAPPCPPRRPQPRVPAGSVPRRTSTARSAWKPRVPRGSGGVPHRTSTSTPQSHKHNHNHTVTNTQPQTQTQAAAISQAQPKRRIYSTQPQHTTTITAQSPRTHKQSREPQNLRPWQHAPHHGMKTIDMSWRGSLEVE